MSPVGFIQSELDLKLLVLYIMDHVAAPITFHQLLELALCDAGVDYFSLTQAVTHMVETGQLERSEELYAITEKGRRNSEICESSLPYSVRLHCNENLVKVNEELRRQAQVQTKILTNEDGSCTLHLQLNDASSPMLSLDLLVPDAAQAIAMSRRFQQDPSQFYLSVVGLLNSPDPES